jgi:hypothetical protein
LLLLDDLLIISFIRLSNIISSVVKMNAQSVSFLKISQSFETSSYLLTKDSS